MTDLHRIAIFYEDERGPVAKFPLHTLVCACVADDLGRTTADVQGKIRGIPKKGDSKLLMACEREVPKMREPCIFALFDQDQLHNLLKVPKSTDMIAALRARVPESRAFFYVLDPNIEGLLHKVSSCLDCPAPARKSKDERDRLLNRAAWNDDRRVRDCIRSGMESFRRFVDDVASVAKVDAVLTFAESIDNTTSDTADGTCPVVPRGIAET
jgi:hypothetical protein